MFYIKTELAEGVTLRSVIEDNVFTTCPGCGAEHCVELDDILKSGEADIYSTCVYCEECSKKRAGGGE